MNEKSRPAKDWLTAVSAMAAVKTAPPPRTITRRRQTSPKIARNGSIALPRRLGRLSSTPT